MAAAATGAPAAVEEKKEDEGRGGSEWRKGRRKEAEVELELLS